VDSWAREGRKPGETDHDSNRRRSIMRLSSLQFALGLCAALVLAACGGGGSGSASTASQTPTVAQAAVSAGTVTAFGSVFVNGHEFSTSGAVISDDDTGLSTTSTNANVANSGLAVGMTVEVKAAADSTSPAPHAAEVHISALARGNVDYSDAAAGTLQVMGQTVNVTSTTVIKDQRSCLNAAMSPCAAISQQSDIGASLQSCSLSGGVYTCTAQPSGVFVQVFGFLSTGQDAVTGTPTSSVQASLVRVLDGNGQVYKALGALGSAAAGTPPARLTINGLTIDTSSACNGLARCSFAVGDVLGALGTTAPSFGTATLNGGAAITLGFTPARIRTRKDGTLTAGATVELEGRVSSVDTAATPNTFALQGVKITVGSGLTTPAAGDQIEITGTVNTDLSITATRIQTERSEAHQGVPFLIEDTLSANALGGTAPPYTLSILGTTVQISDRTRFEDETAGPGAAPFNSATAPAYLADQATPPHVVVVGFVDTSVTPSVLRAVGFRILRAGSTVRLGGRVDLAPISGGTALTVNGQTVSVTGSTTVSGTQATVAGIAAGDFVLVTGTESTTTSAGTTTVSGISANQIRDFGTRNPDQHRD
jgi:hypothetical protein